MLVLRLLHEVSFNCNCMCFFFFLFALSDLHLMLLLARVDLSLLGNNEIQWMRAALKSSLTTILSCFRWLHRKAYNWVHLQLARWRLRRQRARYEREVPLQERLETKQRLAEINARISAVQLDPLWTTPPREYRRGGILAASNTR